MENTLQKRELVEKLLSLILPPQVVSEYMEHVYEEEECYNDPAQVILNNAYWWHSGGDRSDYTIKVVNEQICVYDGGKLVGSIENKYQTRPSTTSSLTAFDRATGRKETKTYKTMKPHIGQLSYRNADIIVTVPGRTDLHYRGTMSGARAYCEEMSIEARF